MQEPGEQLVQYRQGLMRRYGEQAADLRNQAMAWPADRHGAPLAEGEWSPLQVLAHVGSVESLAFVPRLRRIASEDNPFLENFDGDSWMETQFDPQAPAETWLNLFEAARKQGLATLANLSEEGWSRTGVHPAQGQRTLQWWVEYSVSHADEHINQLKPTG
jgi:hypothetical protein